MASPFSRLSRGTSKDLTKPWSRPRAAVLSRFMSSTRHSAATRAVASANSSCSHWGARSYEVI
jgi:hypothetical protein